MGKLDILNKLFRAGEYMGVGPVAFGCPCGQFLRRKPCHGIEFRSFPVRNFPRPNVRREVEIHPMAKYELVLIFDPFLQEQEHVGETEKAQEQVKRRGGNVTNVDVWGRRRMAYPIQKKFEGYYVIISFEGDIDAGNLHELERSMRLNEKCLREMLTRIPDIKPRKEKVKKPKAERQPTETQYGRGGGYGQGQETYSAGTAGAGAGAGSGRYNG